MIYKLCQDDFKDGWASGHVDKVDDSKQVFFITMGGETGDSCDYFVLYPHLNVLLLTF